MGGKIWSKEEEDLYWNELIPHSPKRLGDDLDNEEQPWTWVAKQMRERMGKDARRKYTHLCVCKCIFLVLPMHTHAPAGKQ